MNTTMTTIKKTATTVGVAILFAVMYTACKIPSADAVSAIPAGTVKVSFGSSASSSARTAVPDLAADIAVYALSCTNTATGASSSAEISGTTSYEFTNVAPGNVIVSVSAYSSATTKDSTTLIATGSSSLTLASGEGANVSIPLKMADSGNPGGIALAIQWPTSLADSFAWTIDGTAQPAPTITTSGSQYLATLSVSPVAAGKHIVSIAFKSGTATIGTLAEMVNVYANLTTDKWVDSSGNLAATKTFTANDFGTTGTDIRILVTSGTNSYTESLTSANASLSINVPNSATSVVFMPTAATSGQTIQYAWGAGSYATTPSEQPVALTYTGTTTVLSFKVTNTAGSATQTYTVTVNPAAVISTASQLEQVALVLTGAYVLTADIDLSGYTNWTPLGSDPANAGTPFSGSLDGGGHTISNMTTSTINGDAGLFGYISSTATISNIRLKNISASCTVTDTYKDGIGGLVGENHGTITRCSISGLVSGCGYRSGGLVGNNRAGGVISECYSTATVSTTGYKAGGLVGDNWGTISNCYARGIVSAIDHVGGLVGEMIAGSITNSYAAGAIMSSGRKGGFSSTTGGTFTNDYYDTDTSGCTDTGSGTPKTTTALKSQSTYSDWNFDSIWAIDPDKNGGYPYLRALPVANRIVITSGTSASTLHSLLMNNLDGDFILTGPIDFSSSAWTPIGTSGTPFTGTFDGGGNTVSNFTIDASVGNAGFFAYIGSGGMIKNLQIKNITMTGSSSQVGAIAGNNNGTIYRCSSSGTIAGYSSVGGIVGDNKGMIEECWSNATVTATAYSGGLVGANGSNAGDSDPRTGLIKNCYARGAVTVNNGGGLVGANNDFGYVEKSYAAGPVILSGSAGTAYLQGLIGNCATLHIADCYFDSSKIATSYSNGGVPGTIFGTAESTSAMKTWGTYSGWDNSVWTIDTVYGTVNDGYPYLNNNAP